MKFRFLLLIIVIISLYISAANAALPPVIPLRPLFAPVDRCLATLSPDNSSVVYLGALQQNARKLLVRTLATGDEVVLDSIPGGRLRDLHWSEDGKTIYCQHDDEDATWHAQVYFLPAGKSLVISPRTCNIIDVKPVPNNPAQFLLRGTEDAKTVLYHSEITSENGSKSARIILPVGMNDWSIAPGGTMIAGVRNRKDGARRLELFSPTLADSKQEQPTVKYEWGIGDQGKLFGYTENGKALIISSDKGAPTIRVLRIDAETGGETVLTADEEYDATSTAQDSASVYAVMTEKEKPVWTPLDAGLTDDFALLANAESGAFNISCTNRTDAYWLVSYFYDTSTEKIFIYERATKKLTLFYATNKDLGNYQLAAKHPIEFAARDGLNIHGYLTTPVGIPAKNLPLMLLVHGGPWNRDRWIYSPTVQLLANRGYAVLQVNFRGSTGYGRDFLAAGNHEWGGAMQNDLSDAVAWAVKDGVANPKLIAIMGASYGGYAALCGLSYTPELYVAGVAFAAPSNLAALRSYRGNTHTPSGASEDSAIGNPATEKDFLNSRSPVNVLTNIKAQLLIGQGGKDERVKQQFTDELVLGMQKAAKSVSYYLYPDAGHVLTKEPDIIDYYGHVVEFLGLYLGGR